MGQLGAGSVGRTMAGLAEGSEGSQSRSSITAMLMGGSSGSRLGNPAGIIKPGGAMLVVLVGVVWPHSPSKSQHMIDCEEQGLNSSCFSLWVTMAGGLLEA